MFEHQGIWFPDGEAHFPDWMTKNGEIVEGKGTYQIKKLRAALTHCKEFRKAVDVGGHVGLWSMQLAKCFELVAAFEPVPQYQECFLRNTENIKCTGTNYPVGLFECALGAQFRWVSMVVPELNGGIDSGGTHVGDKSGDVPMRTLDSYNWDEVDFIKIDCEGYELEVLKGARETLARCKPCVIVEQKPHKLGPNFGIKGTPAVDYLLMMGAELKREMSGDYILAWP